MTSWEITPTSGTPLTDNAGNVWTLSASGAVAENGVDVPGGAGTATFAIVNGIYYGQDKSGPWYTYSTVTQIWTPSAAPIAPLPPASPDNTIVLNGTATAIIDAKGNTWTLVKGVVLENGKAAGYSANVAAIAYEKGVIWQHNANGLWWSWNGTTWAGAGTSTSPVPVPIPVTSANDTVVLAGSTAHIIDASGNTWTLGANSTVLENGAAAGYTANVAKMAFVNGSIWQENASNLWWNWNGTTWAGGAGTTTNPITGATPTPTPTPTPTSTKTWGYTTSNGQIFDPNGKVFVANGINVMNNPGYNPSAATMSQDFPSMNFLRLAVYSYDSPASLAAYVNDLTSHGIVVELENHSNNAGNAGGSAGTIFTGAALAQEQQWYHDIATYFGPNGTDPNSKVWFGTNNEPSETDSSGNINQAALSAWQQTTYNTIRATGNMSPVMLESNSWGAGNTNVGYVAADYAQMTNTIWDDHQYGWLSNYSTDPTYVASTLASIVSQSQQIMGANGKMPVIIGEYGNSTTGATIDANGTQMVAAVQAAVASGQVSGAAAWAWGAGNPGDGLTSASGGTGLSSYGQQVAAGILAHP